LSFHENGIQGTKRPIQEIRPIQEKITISKHEDITDLTTLTNSICKEIPSI
jgi:hypothetical protein